MGNATDVLSKVRKNGVGYYDAASNAPKSATDILNDMRVSTYRNNLNSIDIKSLYNDNSFGLSEEEKKKRQKTVDDYKKNLEQLKLYDSSLSDNDYNNMITSLDSLKGKFDLLSQYKTKDDYNKALKEAEEYIKNQQKMDAYDLEAGKKELDYLKGIQKQINDRTATQKAAYGHATKSQKADIDNAKRKATEEINNLLSFGNVYSSGGRSLDDTSAYHGYESADALNKDIAQKEQFYNLAKRHQNLKSLSSVIDLPDFDKYAQKGASAKNPTYDDAMGGLSIGGWLAIGGKDIKNKVAFVRDNYDNWLESTTAHGNGASAYMAPGITSQEAERISKMQDDEIKTYNYYLAKDGKEKAQEYLDMLEETLNGRIAQEKYTYLQGNAWTEIPYQFGAGIHNAFVGAKNLFSSEDYIPYTPTQMASQAVQEDLRGRSKVLGVAGDVASTIGQMLPSIAISYMTSGAASALGASAAASATAGQIAGNAAMGLSAAGNEYQTMLNSGMNKDQARAISIAKGAWEGASEYYLGGIEGLASGKITKKLFGETLEKSGRGMTKAFLEFFGNKAAEGFEEVIQDIGSSIIQGVTTGEWEFSNAEDLAYQFALGVLTAAAMGAPTDIVNTAEVVKNRFSENKLNATLYSLAEDQARLVETGLEQADDTTSKKLAEKYQKTLEKGKNLSGNQITNLVNANERALQSRDIANIKSEVSSYLEKLGETEDVKDLSSAITKTVFTDDSLTVDEISALNNSKYGKRVLNELAPGNLEFGQVSSALSERLNAKSKRFSQVENSATIGDIVTAINKESLTETETPPSNLSPAAFNVHIATDTNTGNEIVFADSPIASVNNGKMTLLLADGSTIDSSDVEFKSDATANLFDTIAKLNVPTALANEFITEYTGGDVNDYIGGMLAGYKYGMMYSGKSLDWVKDHTDNADFNALSDIQQKTAFEMGRTLAKSGTEQRQKSVENEVAKNKKTSQKSNKTTSKGRIKFENGGNFSSLSDIQQKSVSVIGRIVADITHNNVHLFASKEVNGKRVLAHDLRGTKYKAGDKAPNGFYDANGDIWIDLNAGEKGEGTMLWTAAHEFTHFLHDNSPADFKKLSDFLMEKYGEKGVDIDSLIQKETDKLINREIATAKNNGKTLTYAEAEAQLENKYAKQGTSIFEVAHEEVVANSMQKMLSDTNAFFVMEELKAKDRNLWQKIKDFFAKWQKEIRALYDKYKFSGAYADAYEAIKDSIDEVMKLFSEGLVNAGENYAQMNLMDAAVKETAKATTKTTATAKTNTTTKSTVKAKSSAQNAIAEKIIKQTKKTDRTFTSRVGNMYFAGNGYVISAVDLDTFKSLFTTVTNPDLPGTVVENQLNVERVKFNGTAYSYLAGSNQVKSVVLVDGNNQILVNEKYVKYFKGFNFYYSPDNHTTGLLVKDKSNAVVGIVMPMRLDNTVNTEKLDVFNLKTGKTETTTDSDIVRLSKREESNSIKSQIKQNLAALNSMNIVASVNELKTLKDTNSTLKWALNRLKNTGYEIDRKGFGKIVLDAKRISNALRYLKTNEERLAFAVVPQVLKRGMLIDENINHKNRGYDTVTFAGPVEINGERGNLAVVVRQEGKNYYKIHRILSPDGALFEIKNRDTAERAGVNTNDLHLSPADNVSKDTIPSSEQNVNRKFEERGYTLPEPFTTLDNGNVQANVKDLSTEDWQNIYKAMKKAGYDITSANQAKEVYSRMAKDSQYTFNNEQSEAIKEQYGVTQSKYARNPQREAAAKKEFGTTYNYAEAGYILSDGSMLDFSEKRNGGTPGMRSQDHREIASVFADDEVQGEYGDNTPYMNEFINEGNIRLMESQGVTIGQLEPTATQYDRLYNFISRCLNKNGFFYLDVSNDKGYTIEAREYEDNTKPAKIISDIKAYYKNGELPYVSELSQYRYSDRKYLELAKDPEKNEAALREMVEEAARENGYTERLYHQTENDFTVFDTKHKGAGTRDNETPFGIFMKKTDSDIGLKGKKQMQLFAKIENPLKAYSRENLVEQLNRLSPEYKKIKNELNNLDEEYQKKFDDAKKAWRDWLEKWRKDNPNAERREAYNNPEFDSVFSKEELVVDEWTKKASDLDRKAKEIITSALKSNGYDGIILLNDIGSFGRKTDAYIALEPSQVKSADPVTYDDNGNIIPLSERFNTENKDIRFSDRDSKGNILTEEQQEFFADSKIRDKNGNLLVVYHGTKRTFFTFRVGEDIGIHFGNKTTAQNRVGRGKDSVFLECYLNITNPIELDFDAGYWEVDDINSNILVMLVENGYITEEERRNLFKGRKYLNTREQTKDLKNLLVSKGYDGIIYKNYYESNGSKSYIAFDSNQAKLTSNLNPTESRDIRFSEREYDYSKPFSQQIDDYKNNKFPETDTFVVSGTPDVWQSVGFNSLPVTINQKHVDYALYGTKDVDHTIGESLLKQLPTLIKKPVAIIQSQSHPDRAVVILNMTHNNKQVITAIEVDGFGTTNNVRIDSNSLTTLFAKSNALSQLRDAISHTNQGKTELFYWDKKEAINLLQRRGLQLPNRLPQTGFVNSIRDISSNVKIKFNDVTETQQFKRWFGKSKAVNKDGTPRVLYHYTNTDFTVFDTERSGKNQGKTKGDGIYLSTSEDEFSYAGNKAMKLYASIQHPFEMQFTEAEANGIYDKYFKPFHEDRFNTYRPHVINSLMAPVKVFDYLNEAAETNNTKTSTILSELGYDGVHSGSEWVAFKPEQVKSATDNIGTFNINNPDIRYSERDTDNPSNRALLADALMTVAQNDIEKAKLTEYQGKVEQLNKWQNELADINSQIKDLSFSKGKKDMAKIRELREEATKLVNRINIADKQLLRLESTQALQNVLETEKKKAAKRAAERQREIQYRRRESRSQTEIRGKIKRLHGKISQMVLNPTDNSYVPQELFSAALDVLEAVDIRTGKSNKTQEALTKLYDKYEALKKDPDAEYKAAYDETLASMIQDFKKYIASRNIYDESLDSDALQDIYEFAKSIYGTIMDAKNLIGENEKMTIRESGNKIIAEQDAIHETLSDAKIKKLAKFLDDKTSLFYLNSLRAILKMNNYNENSEMVRLFNELNEGLKKKYDFLMMTNKKLDALVKSKEGKKAYDSAVNDIIDFGWGKLTKMQAAQVLLTIEREQAIGTRHIETGGMTVTNPKYHDNATKRRAKGNTKTYKIGKIDRVVDDITKVLAEDEFMREYIKVAQDILHNDTKKAINDTSQILKHRNLAYGNKYIPFVSDSTFTVKDIEGLVHNATIEGRGFTKNTIAGATNALYIEGLDIVLQQAINNAAEYSGLAIPLRNINRAWNVKNDVEGKSVKDSVGNNWGAQGLKLVEQTLTDMQTSRKEDSLAIIDTLKSAFITSTLNGNISVAIKQAASLDTAFAVLNQRLPHQAWTEFVKTVKNYDSIIDEIDEHTSEHWRRRIGLTTDEIAAMKQNSGIFGKVSRNLPTAINGNKWIQMIDCWTTATFWNMAKQDINKAIQKGEYDFKVNSEEYWNEVTKLYEKTIETTQPMYDTLHRSEMQKNNIANKFFMFKTQPLQNAGMIYEATHELAVAKASGDEALKKKAAKKLGNVMLAQARSAITFALMTMLANAIKGKMKRYKDDEDKLTLISLLKRMGIDIGSTATGLVMPVGGTEIYNYLESLFSGNSYQKSLLSYPVADFISQYPTLIEKLCKDPSLKNIANLLTKIGDLTGQPFTNYYNLIQGVGYNITNIANGDFTQFKASEQANKNITDEYLDYIYSGDTVKAKEVYAELLEEKKESIVDNREKNEYKELSPAELLTQAKSNAKSSISDKFRKEYQEAYKNKDTETMQKIRYAMRDTGLYGSGAQIVDQCQKWIKDLKPPQ